MKIPLRGIVFVLIRLGSGVMLANVGYDTGKLILAVGGILVIGTFVYRPLVQIVAAPIGDWEFIYYSTSLSNFSAFPERVFAEGKREAYFEGLPQNVGDYYKLDLRKERLISGVHFNHGDSNKCPDEWQMFLYDRFQSLVSPYKQSGHPPHIGGKGSVIVNRFERTAKVQYFLVRITKASPNHWAIESIRIREQRLFGLWSVVIGRMNQ